MNLRTNVSKALLKRGYKRKGRIHLLRIDDEWSLWVDTGPIGKRSDIAPFVGIRNDYIENAISELLAIPKDDWVGSVGGNVGYLIENEYKYWNDPKQLEEVLNYIEKALEFLRKFLNLEKLPEIWKIDGTKDPMWRYRSIVINLLRKNYNEIKDQLKEAENEFCEFQDEVCEQFIFFRDRVYDIIN